MPSWVSQRDQKDKQDASHNKLPPYASCGSRLRHWLHSPQKVPTCGTGFKASTFIPSQQVAYNRGGIHATPDTSIGYLEAAPIGGQLFAHENSQRDCTAF